MLPLTLGSIRKLRPVISATALTTASMSALTKLSVTVSSAAAATGAKPAHTAKASATMACGPRRGRRASANGWHRSTRFRGQTGARKNVVAAPEGQARKTARIGARRRISQRPRRFRNNSMPGNASAAPKLNQTADGRILRVMLRSPQNRSAATVPAVATSRLFRRLVLGLPFLGLRSPSRRGRRPCMPRSPRARGHAPATPKSTPILSITDGRGARSRSTWKAAAPVSPPRNRRPARHHAGSRAEMPATTHRAGATEGPQARG